MKALVVGAGPAGLMAAEVLADAGFSVVVADAAPSPARKFLLAGRGGLNLTHSEPLDRLLERYGPAAPRLRAAIEAFPPDALRAWSAALGEDTFVGSSGRVFPRGFKATPLLRAWLRRLEALGVALRPRRRLVELSPGGVARFATPDGVETVSAGAIGSTAEKRKREPRPGELMTVRSPPISLANILTTASPRPAPP